jgi:hypothetical protein
MDHKETVVKAYDWIQLAEDRAQLYAFIWSQGRSVNTASGYGLDDRAIQDRSLAGAKDFSSNLLSADRLWGH